MGCSGPTQATIEADTPFHLGESWFELRAGELGISVEEARTRDRAISEDEPPDEDSVARSVKVEAAALWRELCAPCHGMNGDLEGAEALPGNKPRKWGSFGVSMGFFFGGDDMRAGIYRKIKNGVQGEDGQPTAMRAFGHELSREQIWGLVRHIEGF